MTTCLTLFAGGGYQSIGGIDNDPQASYFMVSEHTKAPG
jgi:hypothetical protein